MNPKDDGFACSLLHVPQVTIKTSEKILCSCNLCIVTHVSIIIAMLLSSIIVQKIFLFFNRLTVIAKNFYF